MTQKTNFSERWLVDCVFITIGAIFGFMFVFGVAIHDTWQGNPIRQYPTTLYLQYMVTGAIVAWILLYALAWAFNIIEDTVLEPKRELLDDDDNDKLYDDEVTKWEGGNKNGQNNG